MRRSEVVLDEKQMQVLDTLAFAMTRQKKKRVTRSALIRESINYWLEKVGKSVLSDSEMIILNPTLLDDIAAAIEDLKSGTEYTHEEMLRELEQ
ncbi:MAG: hypothetical protein AB9903_06200 [Vulcanimicrobiota bacterium]